MRAPNATAEAERAVRSHQVMIGSIALRELSTEAQALSRFCGRLHTLQIAVGREKRRQWPASAEDCTGDVSTPLARGTAPGIPPPERTVVNASRRRRGSLARAVNAALLG